MKEDRHCGSSHGNLAPLQLRRVALVAWNFVHTYVCMYFGEELQIWRTTSL